jgi:hypothetical protein
MAEDGVPILSAALIPPPRWKRISHDEETLRRSLDATSREMALLELALDDPSVVGMQRAQALFQLKPLSEKLKQLRQRLSEVASNRTVSAMEAQMEARARSRAQYEDFVGAIEEPREVQKSRLLKQSQALEQRIALLQAQLDPAAPFRPSAELAAVTIERNTFVDEKEQIDEAYKRMEDEDEVRNDRARRHTELVSDTKTRAYHSKELLYSVQYLFQFEDAVLAVVEDPVEAVEFFKMFSSAKFMKEKLEELQNALPDDLMVKKYTDNLLLSQIYICDFFNVGAQYYVTCAGINASHPFCDCDVPLLFMQHVFQMYWMELNLAPIELSCHELSRYNRTINVPGGKFDASLIWHGPNVPKEVWNTHNGTVEIPLIMIQESVATHERELERLQLIRPNPWVAQQRARRKADEEFAKFSTWNAKVQKEQRYQYPVDRLDAHKLRHVGRW